MYGIDLALMLNDVLELKIDPIKHYPTAAMTIVNTIAKSMADALRRGERVRIRGFGTFSIRTKATKYVANMRLHNYRGQFTATKEKQLVKGKKYVYFFPDRQLKALLNQHDGLNYEERRAMKLWDK